MIEFKQKTGKRVIVFPEHVTAIAEGQDDTSTLVLVAGFQTFMIIAHSYDDVVKQIMEYLTETLPELEDRPDAPADPFAYTKTVGGG